jgi:heat shock protein HslJ
MAAGLAACMPRKDTGDPALAKQADMHTSQNSLDWAGVYEGLLPCADCPGVKTRLTLKRDGSYELSTQYLDRQVAPRTVHGRFSWNAGGNAIALDANGGGQRFAVGEGRLSQLDRDGSSTGTPASNRVLTLVSTATTATPPATALVPTLEAHRWTLESATDAQGRRAEAVSSAPGHPFVFDFSGPRLSVQGGCNRMTGGYQIDAAGQLSVGRMAATTMACEASAMRADAALSALLAQPLQVDLADGPSPVLRLVSINKDVLVLHGQPTPEARYGKGSLIFLEVAAQPVACKNPLGADTFCLRVRDLRYDDKGILVGPPGEWRPIHENIDGFTHRTGERNVVRVKRFQRSPAAVGESEAVYVLDLVIESEIVQP